MHCDCYSDLLTHVSDLSMKLVDVFEQLGTSCAAGDFVTRFSALVFDDSSPAARALQLHSSVSAL